MKEDGNANGHELLDRTLLTEGDFGLRQGPVQAKNRRHKPKA
ncbi:hypothetical protein SAMN05880570_0365 [Paenibacillus sp. RU4T]|nr:hypothetical protein SAMN05880555_0365 [Paenibacillus sp. RU4X]SIQ22201.1 hypothetical protein SAMN05880570_0365 [Paenibacillus sp. RU4T]